MPLRKTVTLLLTFILAAAALLPAGRTVQAAAVLSPVSASGGSAHGLAAWSDGTVTGWGYNNYGQVGDGTSINQYIPRRVAGLSSIVQVAAGGSTSFALAKDGTVWGWGQGYSSVIQGDPVLPDQRRGGPVLLEGLQEVSSITTDGSKGIAVKKDGTAVLWYPSYDQSASLPAQIQYVPLASRTGIISAVIDGNEALLLTADGGVIRMGLYNSALNRLIQIGEPVTESTLAASSISAAAASQGEAFLLRKDGQVLRWNQGLHEPAAVAGLNGVYKLQTGFHKLFVLKKNGTLWQWNYNSGALAKPVQVQGGSNITGIWGSTGSFGFAKRKDGTLQGWGEGFDSGLATGSGASTKDEEGYVLLPVQHPLDFRVNGQPFSFYGSAAVIDGRLYVPATSVFKELGVKLSMDSMPDPKFNYYHFRVWTFILGDKKLQVKLSDPVTVYINGQQSDREFIMGHLTDTTQFPLEEICKILGIGLEWNRGSGEVGLSVGGL